MKTPCPRCGRKMVIEEDVGDFPTRCDSCGTLLRRRGKSKGGVLRAERTNSRGGDREALAGLLMRMPRSRREMVMATGSGATAGAGAAARRSVLRPESRREVAKAHARQAAIARASQRGRYQALGALTWAGMILAVVLGIGAVVLKAQALWRHPAPTHGDVLRVE